MDMQTGSGAPDIFAAAVAMRADQPRLRARDLAERLGVSEAELVEAQAEGKARRLDGKWSDLVGEIEALGPVMALTRNESAVHEKTGVYDKVSGHGMMGLALGADIDLRLFYGRWKYGFAVETETDADPRRSLQFFGPDGIAVHKIYLKPESDADAYEALVGRYLADPAIAPLDVTLPETPAPDRPDEAIDVEGLRAGWAALKDVHDFNALLKKHEVGRRQAFRLAGEEWATPVDRQAFRAALELAAIRKDEIMVFVGNKGCIQIHTGPVTTLKEVGPWFNVLDPGFNLHLRQDHVDAAWVVRKPTVDGVVTSLEIFDPAGETIAMMFGKRKPGEAERESWRSIVGAVMSDAQPGAGPAAGSPAGSPPGSPESGTA